MKKTTHSNFYRRAIAPFLITGSLLLSSAASAITLNAGYVFTYNPDGSAIFDSVWNDLSLAPASQVGNAVTLGQNTSLCQDNIGTPGDEEFWCDTARTIVLSSYEAKTVTAAGPTSYTFSGCFGDSTLDGSVLPFIKVFSTTYALFGEVYGADGECWDLSLPSDGAVDVIVQTGYQVTALNLDPRVSTSGTIVAYEGATINPDQAGGGPEGIPVLPLWALFGLAGLIGLMGLRRKS